MSINLISKKLDILKKKEKQINIKYNDISLNKSQHPWINEIIKKEKSDFPFDYKEKLKYNSLKNKLNSKNKKVIVYNENYKKLMNKLVKFKEKSVKYKRKLRLKMSKSKVNKSNIVNNSINNKSGYFFKLINEFDGHDDEEDIKDKIKMNNNIEKFLKLKSQKKKRKNLKTNEFFKYSVLKKNKKTTSSKKVDKFKMLRKDSTIILNNNFDRINKQDSFEILQNKLMSSVIKHELTNKILYQISNYIIKYNDLDSFKKVKYILDFTYNFALLDDNINNINIFITNCDSYYYSLNLIVNKMNFILKNCNKKIMFENINELINLIKTNSDKIFIIIIFKINNKSKKELLDLRIINLDKPYCFKIENLYHLVSKNIFKIFFQNHIKEYKLETLTNLKLKICINKVRTLKLYLITILDYSIKRCKIDSLIASLSLIYRRNPNLKSLINIFKKKEFNEFNSKIQKPKKNFIQYNINSKDYIFDFLIQLKYQNKLTHYGEKFLKLKELIN